MVNEIEEFCKFWLSRRPMNMNSDVYSRVAQNTGAVLYRHEQFQVQLFLAEPNSEITDHIHPNIDSYEVYLGGDFKFRKNGIYITPEDVATGGNVQRVLPNEWHGGTIGPTGGAFISIQHWLNGKKPSSVHLDWGGEALDKEHVKILEKESHDNLLG